MKAKLDSAFSSVRIKGIPVPGFLRRAVLGKVIDQIDARLPEEGIEFIQDIMMKLGLVDHDDLRRVNLS